jgi:hypothetical protein
MATTTTTATMTTSLIFLLRGLEFLHDGPTQQSICQRITFSSTSATRTPYNNKNNNGTCITTASFEQRPPTAIVEPKRHERHNNNINSLIVPTTANTNTTVSVELAVPFMLWNWHLLLCSGIGMP